MEKIKVVPKKRRFEIYNKALEIIESGKDTFRINKDFALCFLLPSIELNVKCWRDVDPSVWTITDKRYVEFGKYHDGYMYRKKFKKLYDTDKNAWRKKILKEIIVKG